jgi:precorrin-2 dehydrogenase / sirohydrochlorin ferrochelatase
MKLLPVALNVQGQRCLIVGGGPVAARKAAALLECEAPIHVIAPDLAAGFVPLRAHIEHEPRPFQTGDCVGHRLIFACTGERAVNEAVAREAHALGLWCNVVDDPAASDFHSAATVRRGDITVGISTAGGSPALARHLKERIEGCVGPEYEALLEMVSARRAALPEHVSRQEERAHIWRSVLDCGALELLRAGRRAEAEALVERIIGG